MKALTALFVFVCVLDVLALSMGERVLYEVVDGVSELQRANRDPASEIPIQTVIKGPELEFFRKTWAAQDASNIRESWWLALKWQVPIAVIFGCGAAQYVVRRDKNRFERYAVSGGLQEWVEREWWNVLLASFVIHFVIAAPVIMVALVLCSQRSLYLVGAIVVIIATPPALCPVIGELDNSLVGESMTSHS